MSDKRRRGLVTVVAADPWRKLLAITLAVMSWFFVDSRINRSYTRPVPLTFVGLQSTGGAAVNRLAVVLPMDRVVGKQFLDGERPIDHVEVKISGPRYRVAEVEKLPIDLQISKYAGEDWSTRTMLEFTAQDLRTEQWLRNDLKIELVPPRIRIDVQMLGEKRFALSTNTVDVRPGIYDGRLQPDSAEFSPDTALVRGSKEALADLMARAVKERLFYATMGEGANDRQARGEVALVDAPGVQLERPTPLVTMQLRPNTMRIQLEVPILVDDLALPPDLRGLYACDERTRTVFVLAGGDLRTTLVSLRESGDKSALTEFVEENLRLVVHVPRLRPGTLLQPEIEGLKARLIVHGRLASILAPNECLLGEVVTVKLKRAP
jgi:hypothetical protein